MTTLKLDLTRNDGQEEHRVLPLRRIAEGRQVDPGLEDAGEGRHWLLFVPSEQGIKVFRELQQNLRGHHDVYKEVNVHVTLELSDAAMNRISKISKLPFSIWQRLNPQEGFIELYTGKMDITLNKNDT
ncbi:MAG TPA: hypothetical protein VFM15_09315 [Gammaproteobacteria bacterium]|nr:hypothetical protein [Gammaproteobacteria bacterium]